MKQQSSGERREARPMNDSTLPPATAAAPAKVPSRRRKTGKFGLGDWVRLCKSAKDLARRKGQPLRKITREEIRQHSSVHDGWISLQGKVYNISPYLHYHPGGVDIMKPCLGRDASSLFEKYHRWVNVDGLVGVLLLGYLDNQQNGRDDDANKTYLPQKHLIKDGFAVPAPRPPKAAMPSVLSPKGEDDDEEDDVNPWEKND